MRSNSRHRAARPEIGDAVPKKRGGMNMSGERAAAFQRLHSSGCFVMPNPWDAGSARALEQLGFKALATTSAGFAWTLGLADDDLGLEAALEHLRVIVDAV